MNKNTLVFNKVKRSEYGTGCSVLKKLLNTEERFVIYHQKIKALESFSTLYMKKFSLNNIVFLCKIHIDVKT